MIEEEKERKTKGGGQGGTWLTWQGYRGMRSRGVEGRGEVRRATGSLEARACLAMAVDTTESPEPSHSSEDRLLW